ncbi:hypothetical protein BOTBODRAFT_33232 [Botryobasidium botryosum FD-172 SS1]|uniref:Lysine-specific metallo-endopeptidase domain-containing protein n=1 Tax=Botryobasidium botryosum (strain FD-172 SS1) TaxID=930990 RepID=A0A067MQD2_BOTB1|nr:hypothetical protein BOTBODRAFT_33232 [Botryobasidium botryosum FD-172 SS1]
MISFGILSSSLFFYAFVLVAPVLATQSLSVSVSGPSSVVDVTNLKVVTTIRNTGDEDVRLLNDPDTVITPQWATHTFGVSKVGSETTPDFHGIKVKWSASLAMESNDTTILAPGQSVNYTHDLSKRYDFTHPGTGKYVITARESFTHVDPSGNVGSIVATQGAPATLSLSGALVDVPPLRRSFRFSRRASFVNCTAAQQTQINQATPQAQTYAKNALAYLKTVKAATPRYTTWFGAFNTTRFDTVVSHFTNISSNSFSSFTYDCSCPPTEPGDDVSGLFAYVDPEVFGYINLCPAFFAAPVNGTDSKGGTIIHESSHFVKNAGTDDNAYGQTAAQALAVATPDLAVDNADSHEYFAENNPVLA